MGWLSRTFRPDAGDVAEATAPAAGGAPPAPSVPVPAAAGRTTGASSPQGRYGPLVSVTRFDTAPPELEWQLPLNGELYRVVPGSDRPDYSLFVLERPVHFYPRDGFDLDRVEPEQQVQDRKGRTMVRVHALLLCARFVGQQLHPGMTDLAVNLAYVIDNSLARDAEVDFAKIEFAGTGFLSEGHAPGHDTETAATTRHTTSDVLDELAWTLRHGIEELRGAPLHRMTAAITVDGDHRLTGLSGNADGQAPVPTPDTFGRMAEVLGRLAELDGGERIASVTLRVDDGGVGHEVTGTHG
ncbi:hypothetical protein [Terrabacter sp. 2YAF2]|uniref:hypothetical protein n=1 Tax=Terrabacter sp. 2YAF2 TaxID=3233026 RepID=UPI003F987033